jgi:hypothetical protein
MIIGMWICMLPFSAMVIVGFLLIDSPSVHFAVISVVRPLVFSSISMPVPFHREKILPEALHILESFPKPLYPKRNGPVLLYLDCGARGDGVGDRCRTYPLSDSA